MHRLNRRRRGSVSPQQKLLEYMNTLLKELKAHYKKHKRSHLPWRATTDPYKILVSELMLQQTQVERVIPFYTRFIKTFPTPKKLAAAPLSKVLLLWQGLGYNRRAKFLHEAAKQITKSSFPNTAEGMEELPGVGHYTARAIAAFARNSPEVFVETNIRTVFIHHLFPRRSNISDAQLLPLVSEALKRSRMEPKDFYAALMDYGSYLKRSGIKLNTRSKHYVKQSKFEGSMRQKRAAKLRELLARGASEKEIEKALRVK